MALNDKRVAITGANGSLGRAIAARALELGARVELLDLRFAEDFRASLPPGDVASHEIDLLNEQATRDCFERIGPVDALCCAAGGFAMGTPVHLTSDDEWQRMHDINVRTVLNAVRAAVPGMAARGAGAIVTVGAAGAVSGAALMAPYVSAKATVMRLSESMADELMGEGINVNCVLPSIIDTPPNRAAMPDADFGDWVSAAQLANVICFLASAEASAVQGALVPVRNRV